MADADKARTLLENAYRLTTPDDSRTYYRAFAETYDEEFADALGYNFPAAVAAAYRDAAGPDDVPVADIGCGTGLVAVALGLPDDQIDGMDISPDMLAHAAEKSLYRDLFEVDLTGDITDISNGYGAVVSAGTFTHGHLGPGALAGLLPIARPGGLFVIGVNRVHFEGLGFAATLAGLESDGRIGPLTIAETRIYTREGHEHSADTAMILCFRRT